MKNWLLTSSLFIPLCFAVPAIAQIDDEHLAYEDVIVVTAAARITQGGAQDIEFFRESVEDGRIPEPAAITPEGLLSSHDMVLRRDAPCEQLFCLTSEMMPADFLAKPEIDNLLGLGFATNIDAETWERAPTTIMAVVDTSGSMDGEPLDLVRASLREVMAHLRPGDRIGIAHYGSTTSVLLPISDAETQRGEILAAIGSLESMGSTNMEEGLKLAFATARKAKAGFDGSTRVMLFTDEQPNVGHTDADSFIGMAREASHDGIGLTTIGVADHFGADLANQISAARGGNLFFVQDEEDISALFGTDFDFLVTEVAHDLKVKVKPRKGVRIAQLHGIPGEEVKRHRSGAVSFTIPSVFLSSKGGGVFLGLDGDMSGKGDFADISLSYVSAKDDVKGGEKLKVTGLTAEPSAGLKLGHILTDEYQVLRSAAHAHAFEGDRAAAAALLGQMEDRMEAFAEAQGSETLEGEVELLSNMRDILLEYQADQDLAAETEPFANSSHTNLSIKQLKADRGLYGAWRIDRVKNTSTSITGKGSIDLREGDLLSFALSESRYDETETFHAQRMKPQGSEPEFESESMEIDEEKRRIKLYHSDIIFRYRKVGDTLKLHPEDTDLVLSLVRPAP